jgi:hypothetical protein
VLDPGHDKFQTFTRRRKAGVPVPLKVVWVVNVRDLQVRNVLPNCSSPVGASATARYDFLHIATETNVFP